jgi:hypothetical protein
MSGTPAGGHKAAVKNRKLHGADFYARIGAIGGKKGTTGGFGAGEEGRARARKYGAIGGRISRRQKATTVAQKVTAQKTTKGDLDLAA